MKWQFSLTYLCLEMLWIACGFGFLTVLIHAPVSLEVHTLTIPFVGACWGAAIGGLRGNMLGGAKAGLLVGFAAMLMAIMLSAGQ
jgi:outer membrane lipoprotein SlyB